MSRLRIRTAVTASAVLALLFSGSWVAQAVPQSVAASFGAETSWGQPVEFGGQQPGAQMAGLSCPAAGSCAAVGMDHSAATGSRAEAWVPFVVNQRARIWGPARRIAGLAALTDGKDALLSAVSCASRGNCTAVGGYTASHGDTRRNIPFAVSEVAGTWGHATPIPGITALASTDSAHLNTVSCLSPGNCTAAGSYVLRFGPRQRQAFVVSQVNGAWQEPRELPGIAALNTGRDAEVESVACHGGACVVGGYFLTTSSRASQPFVAAEKGGIWLDPAQAVRGLPVPGPHQSGQGIVNQVSCAAAGRCEAAGSYVSKSGASEAFAVAEESDTAWHHAVVMPGASALQGKPGQSSVTSLTCISVGNCVVGGVTFRTKRAGAGRREFATAFFATQGGFNLWNPARELPGLSALNKGGEARIQSISCAESRTLLGCVAAGYYTDASGSTQAMVETDTNGRWGQTIELPGSAALNSGGHAQVSAVSCPLLVPRRCAAVGIVTNKTSQRTFGTSTS